MGKIDFIACHFMHNDHKFAFVVTNARENYGHDDTWPFQCDWSIVDLDNLSHSILNGTAWNDGWGGPNESYCEDREKHIEFDNAIKQCFTFVPKSFPGHEPISNDLADIACELSMQYVSGHRGCYTMETMFKVIDF